MYTAHFGFTEKPFSITPDADYLYPSSKHRAAMAMLEYGVFEQSGITVITGDIGTGKTTLIRKLLQELPYDKVAIGLISNTHRSLGTLMQWVGFSLDLVEHSEVLSDMQVFRRLQNHLISEYANQRRVVLVIDEAQNMDASSLEELRMLMNINSDKNDLLQIVLVGQPELFELLQQPGMKQLAQRVTAEYHLERLNYDETCEYIQSRLQTAGADRKNLFDREATEIVFTHSGGVPRLINILCDHALVLAYGDDRMQVDANIAREAVSQKRIIGLMNLSPAGVEESTEALVGVGRCEDLI